MTTHARHCFTPTVHLHRLRPVTQGKYMHDNASALL